MKKSIYIIILMLSTLSVKAQQHSIRCTLSDNQTGKAVSGALIFYNHQYTVSDENGVFQLEISDSKPVNIVISHMGYQSIEKTLKADGNDALSIQMKSSVKLLEEVLISSESRPLVAQQRINRETIRNDNAKNIGDIFKDKAGFGIIKRGGYSLDPVFRSFKYEQLNLIYDGGVYISNACPNRMDPASVQMSPAEIDRIELVKGPYSVRYGQTMGALINIITNKPQSSDVFKINGTLEGGYEVNGNGITGLGAITAVGKKYDLSFQGGMQSFDDYKDGDGTTIPSAFSTSNYVAKLGFNPTPNQRLQIQWRQSFGQDIKHASLPMDSPKDNSSILSVDYAAGNLSEKLGSINAKVYYTYVDHLMTNENRPNFKAVEAASPVTSNTLGGRLELGLTPNDKSNIFVGTDVRTVGKDGVRNRLVKIMNGQPLDPPKEFTDLIWQDSWLYDIGIFSEATFFLNEKWATLIGARLDYVKSGANNPAPDFEALYGKITPESEVNFSLTGSLNYNFSAAGLLQFSLGRGQRSADLLERYINHFNVGLDSYEYIGNPYLKSEINNQIDITLKNVSGKLFWSANVFYSYMQDYITAVVDESIPRKYMPNLAPKYTKKFINIDKAWQTGFDLELGYNFTQTLSGNAGVYYTVAENIDFDEPLAEIPPLAGLFTIKYEKEKYYTAFKGRLVAAQNRVAESFDEATSPGFSVFDITAGYSPAKNINIDFAFKNIFDVNYFEHLSRPYANQSEAGLFYEPGRSFRIGLRLSF